MIYDKILKRQFNKITVEECVPFTTGRFPPGYSQFDKAGTADDVAHWTSDNCISCNQCASACPHGVIRPFIIDEKIAKGKQTKDGNFVIQISPLDCKGCQVCAHACPKKCIDMRPLDGEIQQQ